MATVKILLYKSKKNSSGEHPIVLRITKDRVSKYKFLVYISEKDWNEKKREVRTSHLSYKQINNLIANEEVRARNLIMEYEATNRNFTSAQLITILKGKKSSNGKVTFMTVANQYLENALKMESIASYNADKSRINKFKKFLPGGDIEFENITISLLKKYEVFMTVNGYKSQTTRANNLSLIRKLFNDAISEGIVSERYYPFGRRGIKFQHGSTIKIGLNVEETLRLEMLELEENSFLWHTNNIWLMMFYLAGMRIADTLQLRWSNVNDSRVTYKMNKNKKILSLPVHLKVEMMLEKYKRYQENPDDLIFPFLKHVDFSNAVGVRSAINSACVKINKHLKVIRHLANIDKNLSCHIARHTFGNIAGSEVGSRSLQRLLCHTDIATTERYQANLGHSQMDEAYIQALDY